MTHAGQLQWWAAHARAASVPPLSPREVDLSVALGAVLTAPLVAALTTPAHDLAAMDGYAVRGSPPWQVCGRTLAGAAPPPSLAEGDAWEVTTGAVVPSNCDRVLPYEVVRLAGSVLTGEGSASRHVRPRGEQCFADEELLPAGTPVSPVVLGLAAQAGLDTLAVRPVPTVTLLVSGDELASAGRPEPGQTRDVLGPMLPGLITAWRGRLDTVEHLADTPSAMDEALRQHDGDLLVMTGASSRGPADHLRPALLSLGATMVIDGVACRPGHPMLLARLPDGRHVVGLPGNPLAALVAALTLLRPLLSALGGRGFPEILQAQSSCDHPGHPSDVSLVPVRRVALGVSPMKHVGAAQLRGVAGADGVAVIPAGGVREGDLVDLLPLPAAQGSQ